MSLIELCTFIAAPPERCFDLSLSVDIHLASTARTQERVVSGPMSGLLALGDTVTWEAKHLGFRRRLTVQITKWDRPRTFRDEMIAGPFRRMRHDHWFDPADGGTRMRDEFEFATSVPPFDSVVLVPHLRRLLLERNEMIRAAAQGAGWRQYLNESNTLARDRRASGHVPDSSSKPTT